MTDFKNISDSHKEFLKFLYDNGCLNKWLYNKTNLSYSFHHSKDLFFDTDVEPYSIVEAGSFHWGASKEGTHFWEGVMDKWKAYCNKKADEGIII